MVADWHFYCMTAARRPVTSEIIVPHPPYIRTSAGLAALSR